MTLQVATQIPIHRRIGVKLTSGFVSLLIIVFLVGTGFALRISEDAFDKVVRGEFEVTLKAVENIIQYEVENITAWQQHFIEDEKDIGHHISREDWRGLYDLFDRDYKEGFPFAITLLDRSGRVVFRHHDLVSQGDTLAHLDVAKAALAGKANNAAIVNELNRFMLYTSAPVFHEKEVVGAILIGKQIDNDFAERVKGETDMDLTIVRDRAIMASTLKNHLGENIADLPIPYLEYQILLAKTEHVLEARFLGQRYFVIAKPLSLMGKHTPGSIFLSMSRARLDTIRSEITRRFAILVALSVLIAGTAGTLLTRRLVGSINVLTHRANTIALGRSHEPIDVNANDEIGALARSFNIMLDSIESKNAALRDHRDNLESQVVERTRELSESEEQLRRALDVAQRSSQAKSEFLASMSHELRTPLNAVLGFAQILQSDFRNPLTAEQIKHTEYILDGGNHLLELINQVLDLARVEADQLELSLEDVNVSEVVAECVALTVPLGKPEGIVIINELDSGSTSHLRADRLRLKQILVNLLSNAIKYNNDGGTVTITGRETDNGFLRIFVSDTGIGIAEKDHQSVFQMFHRLGIPASQPKEGTGIGLCVTKLLVEKMAGRIGFESRERIGSTFWVELPLAANEEVLIWEDSLRVGVDAIDKDHQVIVSLLNRVSQTSVDEADVDAVIGEMIDHTGYHFAREEAIMKVCGYPDIEMHRKQHQALMTRVNDLVNAWHNDRDPETHHRLREFLRSWWIGHIKSVDTEIADYTPGKAQDIREALESIG